MRDDGADCPNTLPVVAGVPIDLFQSMQGKFFVGSAENLCFGKGTGAWAGLYNPPDSGVDLYLWTFGISGVENSAYRIQIWFGALFPGEPRDSNLVSPADTSFAVLPTPKVKLKYAAQTTGSPSGGIKAFVRRGQPGTAILSIEDGKFIFPPGCNVTIYLSNPEAPEIEAYGKISYQWWEEKI